MSFEITVEGGKSVRLPTKGKYCDRDIVVTAEGGAEDLEAVLAEQEGLIAELQDTLRGKAAGGEVAEPIIEPLEVTENGTYAAPDGVAGYYPVIVNVPIPDGYIIPAGTKDITENGTHDVKQYEAVAVNVPIPDGYIVPSGELEVTENGEYDVTEKASVVVAVPDQEVMLQDKEITENGTYTADDGYDGLGQVVVNVAGGGGDENQLHGTLDGTLTAIDSPVTKVISYACYGITTLQTVNLPNATSFGGYCFRGCSGLTTINAPKVTSLGSYTFYGCSKLKEVNFPLATSVTSTCFYQCSAMTKADFGVNCKSIAASGMAYCTGLRTLILRYTGGVVSTTTNAFSGVSSYKGYVYVPKALLEDYEATAAASTSSTNSWHLFEGKFRAIEDYPEICGEVAA